MIRKLKRAGLMLAFGIVALMGFNTQNASAGDFNSLDDLLKAQCAEYGIPVQNCSTSSVEQHIFNTSNNAEAKTSVKVEGDEAAAYSPSVRGGNGQHPCQLAGWGINAGVVGFAAGVSIPGEVDTEDCPYFMGADKSNDPELKKMFLLGSKTGEKAVEKAKVRQAEAEAEHQRALEASDATLLEMGVSTQTIKDINAYNVLGNQIIDGAKNNKSLDQWAREQASLVWLQGAKLRQRAIEQATLRLIHAKGSGDLATYRGPQDLLTPIGLLAQQASKKDEPLYATKPAVELPPRGVVSEYNPRLKNQYRYGDKVTYNGVVWTVVDKDSLEGMEWFNVADVQSRKLFVPDASTGKRGYGEPYSW